MEAKYSIPESGMVSQSCWCGDARSKTVSKKDRWGQPLTTVICQGCGTLRLDPRMSSARAQKFYESEYEDANEPKAFFESQRSAKADLYLAGFLTGARTILDYGSGPGGKLAPLVERGFEVVAYDMNPQYLQQAESHGLRRWNPNSRYDCIFLSHTIEHWIHPRADLEKLLAENLQPAGLVIIEVPLIDRLILGGRRQGFFEETHVAHAWYFSVATLSAMMQSLGFVIEFSDHVTICVFRHAPGRKKTSPFGYLRARFTLALIGLATGRLSGAMIRYFNRATSHIDVDFKNREIARAAKKVRPAPPPG